VSKQACSAAFPLQIIEKFYRCVDHPKIMLHYRPNVRRRLGRHLKRLLDEAELGLSRPNSWQMMMMIMMTNNDY
jgi:hypothetical protein